MGKTEEEKAKKKADKQAKRDAKDKEREAERAAKKSDKKKTEHDSDEEIAPEPIPIPIPPSDNELDPTKLVKIPIVPVSPPKNAPSKKASNLPVRQLDEMVYKLPLYPATWNIVKLGWGSTQHEPHLTSIIKVGGTDVLQVNYPKGSFKPAKIAPIRGGLGFYSLPPMVGKSRGATLSYDIYFDDSFDPRFGTKIPGIYGGSELSVSGGKHDNPNSFSIRLMTRQAVDENSFYGEAYAYISTVQHPEYKSIPGLHENATYGSSMWRGELLFYKRKWNNVSVSCKLNTKGNFDGYLELTINDKTCSFDKLKYVDDPAQVPSLGVICHYFFGGGTDLWATDRDTASYTTNFNLITWP